MTGRRGRRAAERDVYGRADVAAVLPAVAAELDRSAREQEGIPERVLMENAGRAAALVLDRLFPQGEVVVVAGSGNNGGDAAVVARTLLAWGRAVRLFTAGSSPPDAALRHGFELEYEDPAGLASAAAGAAVVVDGILGTGARGAPRAPAAAIIDVLNASGRPVLALDLPSGVDAATGRVEAVAIRAAVTVTFGWPKTGLMFQPARTQCGRLIAVEIGFPPLERGGADALLTPDWAASRLTPRPPDAHKGISGRLLILAGSNGMAGAAVIAARSAQRAGTGLVRLASTAGNRLIVQNAVPEATFVDRMLLGPSDAEPVRAMVAGPGIGTDGVARDALESAIELTPGRPSIFDADAINLFALDPDRLIRVAADRATVITPHPAEMARLSASSIEAITSDPLGAAKAAADRFHCVVLLKGQPSVIAAPGEATLINTSGSSDVAAGGMGDQLSGAVGAMLAAGLDARSAAGVALYFSGRAADLAQLGRSLSPLDVADALPAAFADPGARSSSLRLPFVTFDQPPRW